MMYRALLVLCAAMGLAACNPMANLDEAEKQINRFEKAYSAGDADRLWSMTGDTWKETGPRADFDNMNEVLSARLGAIVSSERSNFKVNSTNGLTTTVVVMDTDFEEGEGQQTYTFHGGGEDMELVGWNVVSPRLRLTVDDLRQDEETNSDDASAGEPPPAEIYAE